MRFCQRETNPHRPVVDLDTVVFGSSLSSSTSLGEDDRSNAPALAIGTVRQENLFDGSDGLAEVLL